MRKRYACVLMALMAGTALSGPVFADSTGS